MGNFQSRGSTGVNDDRAHVAMADAVYRLRERMSPRGTFRTKIHGKVDEVNWPLHAFASSYI